MANRHYTVLPLDDGDEFVIFDTLSAYALDVAAVGKNPELVQQLHRICAELGYAEDHARHEGGRGDEFHVTAHVDWEDPRPPEGDGRISWVGNFLANYTADVLDEGDIPPLNPRLARGVQDVITNLLTPAYRYGVKETLSIFTHVLLRHDPSVDHEDKSRIAVAVGGQILALDMRATHDHEDEAA